MRLRAMSSRLLIVTTSVVMMVGMISLYVSRPNQGPRHPAQSAPPVRIALPDFALVERSGKILTRSDLAGHVWIADFIFTSCAGPCPLMTRHMRSLQDDLEALPGLRLVSFSVDPERDTPEVLSSYARRHGADPTRWLFCTGTMDQIYDLAIDGFKIAVAEARDNHQIIHDTRFILVDSEGHIRGYYDSNSAAELQRLRKDTHHLSAS